MAQSLPALRRRASANASGPEIQIAHLKTETAALVASGQARLNALSPQERLAAQPEIWKVSDAITEFSDCAKCPPMVVIPAGEFTMESPPSEQNAETQHRVALACHLPSANSKITFEDWDVRVMEGGCEGYPIWTWLPPSLPTRLPGSLPTALTRRVRANLTYLLRSRGAVCKTGDRLTARWSSPYPQQFSFWRLKCFRVESGSRDCDSGFFNRRTRRAVVCLRSGFRRGGPRLGTPGMW